MAAHRIPVGGGEKAQAELAHGFAGAPQHCDQDANEHEAHQRGQDHGEPLKTEVEKFFPRWSSPMCEEIGALTRSHGVSESTKI